MAGDTGQPATWARAPEATLGPGQWLRLIPALHGHWTQHRHAVDMAMCPSWEERGAAVGVGDPQFVKEKIARKKQDAVLKEKPSRYKVLFGELGN